MAAKMSLLSALMLALAGTAAACGGKRKPPCADGSCTFKPKGPSGRSAPNDKGVCVECGYSGKPACQTNPVCLPGTSFDDSGSGVPRCRGMPNSGGSPPSPPPPSPPSPSPPSSGGLPGAFAYKASDCHKTTRILNTPIARDKLKIRQAPRSSGYYDAYKNKNWVMPMPFNNLKKGGKMCMGEFNPGDKQIDVGGVVVWHNGNKCHLPPTKPNGSPCCTLKIFQPDGAGYYHPYCSAKQSIGADGLWWVKTVLPGDEETTGWGPDDAGHIHIQVDCNGCKQNSAFSGTKYDGTAGFPGTAKGQGANKFYTKGVCTLDQCKPFADSTHQAEEISKDVYKYTIVL